MITLSLTFSSISIIAGGDGLVEYHFSIFMVIAFIAFFESIKLLATSTVIFGLHHIIGYFLFPELICGTSNYQFSLLLIHAVYLIFTSGATILLIYTKQKQTKLLEEVNKIHQENTQSLIRNLYDTGEDIKDYVVKLSQSSRETTEASHEAAVSMEELTKGAKEQLESSMKSEKVFENMDRAVDQMRDAFDAASQSSANSTQQAALGMKSIMEVIDKMQSIELTVNDINELVHEFQEQSEQIDKMAQTISDISRQTKMLALNASIEAARAGGHGKGFAVVSHEVGKLALQTEESARGIGNVVTKIMADMNRLNKAIDHSSTEVKSGTITVQRANKVFQDIIQASSNVEKQVLDVKMSADELKEFSEYVMENLIDIREVSEGILKRSEAILDYSKKQAANTSSLDSISNSLNRRVASLNQVVSKINNDKELQGGLASEKIL